MSDWPLPQDLGVMLSAGPVSPSWVSARWKVEAIASKVGSTALCPQAACQLRLYTIKEGPCTDRCREGTVN